MESLAAKATVASAAFMVGHLAYFKITFTGEFLANLKKGQFFRPFFNSAPVQRQRSFLTLN
jgi:hypothetical protein